MAKSDYLATTFMNYVLRGGAFSAPANVYVSLHTTDPGDTGAGEVTGGSYARVAVPNNAANWTAPAADVDGILFVENAIEITFPSPTADWGLISHVAIWDNGTAGNVLWYGTVATPRTVVSGDVGPHFAEGALSLKEA